MFGYGVIATFTPRMTSYDPAQPYPRSVDYTIALDRLVRVLAACWLIPARVIHKPK
jgi:hypothetical protein